MKRCQSLSICVAAVAGLLFLVAETSSAQPRDRGRDRDQPADVQVNPPRVAPQGNNGREGGIPMRDIAPMRQGDDQEGTLDGMPELQHRGGNVRVQPYIVPGGNWKLGVYAYNTETGVVISRVTRNSAAADVGLERGDRIVTVSGFQVGIIEGSLYPLGEELQRRADRRGNVQLLVQNVRNNRLVNLSVRLDN